jgi:uncharacterized protein (TIGR02186 family)
VTRAITIAVFSLALLVGQARADDLDAGASVDSIRITYSFTGAQVLIFGSITGTDVASTSGSDVVILLRGPEANFIVRRKEPLGPIWLNQDRTKFHAVPGFYFIASTRPLKDIAPTTVLARYELGLDHLRLEPMKRPRAGDVQVYGEAFIAEMNEAGLYKQVSGGDDGIYFIGKSLFSVKIDLPDSVPVGPYTVRALLIKDGNVIGDKSWQLPVEKFGIERWLYSVAHDEPAVFGFAAVAISIFFGWAASMFFRRQV